MVTYSLPRELALPSVLNDDKVKNVVTYFLPQELAQPSLRNGDEVKIRWPTPLSQELVQPSLLNGDKVKIIPLSQELPSDKVKNEVTYSPPPRTGPVLSA